MMKRDLKTALSAGEAVVHDGAANMQRGIETVGGWLFLTDARLIFESHKFNIQNGATEMTIADIAGVEKCWTRFLGIVPIMPNSVAVRTRQGDAHKFVLWGRAAWIEAIVGKLS